MKKDTNIQVNDVSNSVLSNSAIVQENKKENPRYAEIEKRVNKRIDEIERNISDLHKTLKKDKSESKPDSAWKSFWPGFFLLLAIFACSVLFFLLALSLRERFKFDISDESVVLTFVGIAATFVVVSNYAQVKEIKDEYNGKFKEIDRKFASKINKDRAFFRESFFNLSNVTLCHMTASIESENFTFAALFWSQYADYTPFLELLNEEQKEDLKTNVFMYMDKVFNNEIIDKIKGLKEENSVREGIMNALRNLKKVSDDKRIDNLLNKLTEDII